MKGSLPIRRRLYKGEKGKSKGGKKSFGRLVSMRQWKIRKIELYYQIYEEEESLVGGEGTRKKVSSFPRREIDFPPGRGNGKKETS